MAISYRDTHQSGCGYSYCDLGDELTNRLNEAHGVFLTFTKRYHEIRVAAHDLDKKVKKEPSPFDEGDPNYCLTQETFEMRANWGSITGKTWATAPACALPSVRPLQGRTSRARLPAGPSSLPG